jgi:hypothetical protein
MIVAHTKSSLMVNADIYYFWWKMGFNGDRKSFRGKIIVCPGAYNKNNTGVVLSSVEELYKFVADPSGIYCRQI